MQYIPHDYQQKAYDWIISKPKCALFLDMGMGKTVVSMTAIADLIMIGEVSRVLVIAPKRVCEDTWTREADKWDHLSHLRISKVLGTTRQRLAALDADADIYVINRENVQWLCENHAWDFDMVVIDELSSFKTPSAKRFKALRKQITAASRVVGLTGTPAPNGYLALWPEVYLLDQGKRLGRTISSFRDTFFKNVSRDPSYGIYELLPRADKEINRRISDICMSMSAEDYLKMPERIDNIIHVRMSPAEAREYKELEQKQFLELDDAEITAVSAATLSGKLLQLANGFLYDTEGTAHHVHERKIEALKEIIDVNPDDNVMVFYNYKADLQSLRKAFPHSRVLDTTEDIADWNNGKIPLLLAHPQSVGHGLNLQGGGHIIVWYGLTWSLEAYQQACSRLYRQGQASQVVIIHHLVCQGTVDEQVMKALKGKAITQSNLINALKERAKTYGKVAKGKTKEEA